MANGIYLRKYGVEATIDFELFEVDGVDFRVDAAHAAGDSVVMKDEGAEASTSNGFTDEGTGYSLVLTATEMQAARVVVHLADLTATKVWLDKTLIIETYGNASAQHAFDLDTASQVVASVTGAVGSVTGAVGSVTGAVGSVTGHTNQTADHAAAIATIDTEVGAIQTDLDNGTDGLGAIKTAVDGAATPAEVATALTDIHLDHLLAVDYDPASKPGTSTALLNELVEDDSGVSRYTVNALENAPSGTGASAATIADAVWDEDIIAAHNTSDTAGKIVGDNINAPLDTIDTVVDAIKLITDALPDSGALTSLAQASALSTHDGKLDTVDTVVDRIEVDTQDLQTQIGTAGAGLTNITLANDLSAAMKTSVQTAVDAAIDTAISELGVAAPTATPTLRTGLMLLYMGLRNKLVVQTSGTDAIELYNNAGTKIAAKTITDDGSDYTEAEMA